jgi:protein-S-isoprenylcysteine O-methyltransferase Ste14
MRSAFAVEHKPWWKGSRGEWFVVVQLGLIGLVFFGPRTVFGQPAWGFPFPHACSVLGGVMMVVGAVLLAFGLVGLGRNLTPLPYPKDGATLVDTGAYGLVRHPMYGGGVLLGLGWALYVYGWLTLAYVIALFVFLDVKSRREEKWLAERFPKYSAYQQRVRKLIPFVY